MRGSARRWTLAMLVASGCGRDTPRVQPQPRPWLSAAPVATAPVSPATAVADPVAAEAAASPEPERGGYWLGVDLIGPAAAQRAAITELSAGLSLRDPVDVTPPGILVGHVDEIQAALAWIDAHAFAPSPPMPDDPWALHEDPAPAVAGGLRSRHGVSLVAFVISGATADLRPRKIDWPQDQASVLPPGSTWQAAALVPDRAPMFAAPAPVVPPAAERHAMAWRRGGLFVLGSLDRCADTPDGPRCLRWAMVVARDGDRFTPGYLPMAQVALRDAWVEGAQPLPRAQLIPTGVDPDGAEWVLLARTRDNVLHRQTLLAPGSTAGWPRATLRVEGETATVTWDDAPPRRIPLDASLDARPPSPPSDPTESGTDGDE